MKINDEKESVLDEMKSTLREWFSAGHPVMNFLIFVLALIAVWVIFTCFYRIEVDEIGIIQRFGKFERTAQRGLNFKLPWGIEKLRRVKITTIYTEEFGFRTIVPGIKTKYDQDGKYLDESLMLTGDLNCAVVPFIIQYRVGDPYKYLFKVRNIKTTLCDMSEAVMRQIIGDRSINEVINHRQEIASHAHVMLQGVLDEAETGIIVTNLELKTTNVPSLVEPSFNEVNQAVQEKEKMIYQAKEEYNKAVPNAMGEAEKIVKIAEGYAIDRVNKAKGDVSRFMELYKEFTKAKDVTRRRLYFEAMKEVLPKLGPKYITDNENKNLLPLLNLGKEAAK